MSYGEATPEPRFSLVLPCYNEENAVRQTVASLRASLPDPRTYELIAVDDGSTDRTAEVLQTLAAEDSGLRVVRHASNRGYGAALKTGIRHSRSDLIVITDADGTYPNERIPELLDAVRDVDMVVGARTAADASYPLIRRIPKVFLKAYACWLAGQNIPDLNSGLRVFRRPVAEKFLNVLPDGFSFTTTITLAMLTNNYAVRYVPIGYSPRIGKSKIRPIRDTLMFVQLIVRTGTYFAPMRVFFPVAVLLFAAFLVSAAYDTLYLSNLTDKTVLLLLFALNSGMFALLADMIDKRGSR